MDDENLQRLHRKHADHRRARLREIAARVRHEAISAKIRNDHQDITATTTPSIVTQRRIEDVRRRANLEEQIIRHHDERRRIELDIQALSARMLLHRRPERNDG